MDAFINGVSCYVPPQVVTNNDLQAENPDWDMARIEQKTGIKSRHIVTGNESVSDLACAAGNRLLNELMFDRSMVDWVLLCTQSPDYHLPTTACIVQDRLGLSKRCGALDFNLGCSGYIYGLSLAKALVESGMGKNVLLLTAETYSRYVHPRDRSVRTIFGDGASATLITTDSCGAKLGIFGLGTDGSRHQDLIVSNKQRPDLEDGASECLGSDTMAAYLYMNGSEIFNFTLDVVPSIIDETLQKSNLAADDIDWFIFHQANQFMNEHLRKKVGIPKDKAPLCLAEYGNTVSGTIPITLVNVGGSFLPAQRIMLVGFGVGLSWGACLLDWNRVPLFMAGNIGV